MHNKSKQAYQEALRYIPGGVNSPVRSLKAVNYHPIFIAKAKGPYIFDIDNNKYIDFCLSWGVHILGHNHPAVIKAVRQALKEGTSYGAATEKETKFAQMIVNAVPSIEKLRFVSSGTEATMSAIKLARAFSKKKKIIKFIGCYHGHAEIPDVINIPFNDKKSLEKIFKNNKAEIAAVIVEPVAANMGVVLPKEGFLKFLREITEQNNTVLIFDEVITGFRYSLGGAQEYFNIKPDLTCLGKIIGGGFPVGAFGGKAEIMNMLAPDGEVYQAGTLSGNPIAMSAGLAVLKILSQKDIYHNLNKKSEKFINSLKIILENKGYQVNSFGSMFTIFFNKSKKSELKKFGKFYLKLLKQGIYLSPAQFEANFISAAHTEKQLNIMLNGMMELL